MSDRRDMARKLDMAAVFMQEVTAVDRLEEREDAADLHAATALMLAEAADSLRSAQDQLDEEKR